MAFNAISRWLRSSRTRVLGPTAICLISRFEQRISHAGIVLVNARLTADDPAFAAKQRIHVDIDLALGPDVTDFKTVGCKAVLHQPDLLEADHLLPRVGENEGGGRRP